MDSTELTVRIAGDSKHRILYVEGRLDLPNAPVLRQSLIDGLPGLGDTNDAVPCTVIDLAGLEALDLCGLQLLCSAHRTYVLRGGELSLQHVLPSLRQAAAAAGFTRATLRCCYRRGDVCLWCDSGARG